MHFGERGGFGGGKKKAAGRNAFEVMKMDAGERAAMQQLT
jgi:hypothetical protein